MTSTGWSQKNPSEKIAGGWTQAEIPRQKTHPRIIPSGNLLHSYWKWQFIVDFPIENGDFP